jgi:hypothetical protein
MRHRTTVIAWLAAGLVLFTGSSGATSVTVVTTATVTQTSYEPEFQWGVNPFPGLAVGDVLTASFTYDTTATYGLVPLGCCTVGYSVPEYQVSGDDIGFGGYAVGNFTDSSVSVVLPGSGRYFPEWTSSLNLQFSPDYFSAIPPGYMDTSALVAGTLFGSYAQNPFSLLTFTAIVNSVATPSVPIPPTAVLFGSALLALIGRRLIASIKKSRPPTPVGPRQDG